MLRKVLEEKDKVKGTVMQIEKNTDKWFAYVFQKYPENFGFELFIILQ